MKTLLSKTLSRTVQFTAVLILVFQGVLPVSASATFHNDKIYICHSSQPNPSQGGGAGPQNNPYQRIEVSKNAADGIAGNQQGQGDHIAEHNGPLFVPGTSQNYWGDIIPPIAGVHNGLNWTSAGQAIWNNNCDTNSARVEVKKVVVPAQDSGKFNLLVEGDTYASNIGNGGTTGEVYVDENDHITVGETQGTNTLLSNYATTIVCRKDNGTGRIVKSGDATSVTIYSWDIDKNDDIVCVITNTRETGNIKVNKKVDVGRGYVNDNPSNYGFKWGIDNEAPTRAMGSTAAGVTTGNHTITENSVNGYGFTGWYYTAQEDNYGYHQVNCENPQGRTLPVPVSVENGKTKEVTLCNQVRRGTITIVKDSQPNSSQDFKFESNEVSDFYLDDDANGTLSNTKLIGNLLPGSYTFTEKELAGWSLDSIVCSQGANVQVNVANRTVTITLGAGDAVSCTFVNKKHGKIIVDKKTLPAGSNEHFSVSISGNGVLGSTDKTVSDANNAYFTVKQGTYSISEAAEYGWVVDSNTCAQVTITAENLEATCEIVNRKKSSIKIIKDAHPSSAQDFTFTTNLGDNFQLDDDEDATLNNWKKFSNLQPGVAYTFSELPVEGWRLDDVDCDNVASWSFDEDTDTLTVTLAPGEDARCTFENDGNVGGGNTGRLHGHKFEDINGDGEWDKELEPTIEDWKINLYKLCTYVEQQPIDSISSFMSINQVDEDEVVCEDTLVDTTTTNSAGVYVFDVHAMGTYLICEEQVAEWVQTAPGEDGCHEVVVGRSGFYLDNDFGNQHRPHSMTFTTAPVCQNGFPYLRWTVVPTNFTPTTFNLEWFTAAGNAAGDPAGVSVQTQVINPAEVSYDAVTNTYSGLVLWPGANTVLPDWPGWELVNGQWVENPKDFGGNLRPSAMVTMTVNPTVSTTADYPPASAGCNPPQVLGLANTGSSLAQGSIIGISIILTAAGITLLSRRKLQS